MSDSSEEAAGGHDGSSLYASAFYLSCVFTAAVVLYGRKMNSESTTELPSEAFKRFQGTYLGVYYLMVAGDWLQGPYVYALYDSYGFSKSDIAVLFVAGFGSSMVFGTFIGSLADKMGRKNFCILYAAFYIASCMTKHFNDFWILMLGRLLGGISTSLLFSTFETWLVCEHNKRNFPGEWLSKTFSLQFFGNSIVAIVSGVVAQWGADSQALTPTSTSWSFNYGGYTAPFDMAIFVLLIGGLATLSMWDENFGNSENAEGPCSAAAMQRAIDLMKRTPTIVLCGAIQSFFEGAMYTFVFMWTPALTPPNSSPPYGQIFATFMVCCMAGSSMYPIIAKSTKPVQILQKVMAVSAVSLSMPMLTSSPSLIFGGFLCFEFCVGLYFPAISTLKSTVVPEASRAAIYNLFRVPLNVIVLGVLLSDISTTTAFACCTVLLAAGFYFTLQIAKYSLEDGSSAESPEDVEKGVQMQENNLDDLLGGDSEDR